MSKREQFEESRSLTTEEIAQIDARKQAAIQVAMRTPGTITKHVRLLIDFHITIAGTPPDDDGLNEPDPVYHAQQARLLAAIKNSPEVLKRRTNSLIVGQMQQKDWSFWDTLIGGDIAFQDLLAPALAALSEDDRNYFDHVPKGQCHSNKKNG